MNIYPVDLNTKLAAIYYNEEGGPNLLMVQVDITLSRLKGYLDPINCRPNHRDIRTMFNVEYRRP